MNNYNYLQLKINPYYYEKDNSITVSCDSFYVTHETSKKMLSMGKMKKDYYQNLTLIYYERSEEGLDSIHTHDKEEYKDGVLEFKLLKGYDDNEEVILHGTVTMDKSSKFHETIYLDEELDYFIYHPSWRTTKFDLYFTHKGIKKHMHIENDKERMSRYLFAFAVSCTDDRFSTDPDNIVTIENVE